MKRDTLLTHAGRNPHANHGIVNPPVYHASTVLYRDLASYEAAMKKREYGKTYYGLMGTPTTFSLEEAVAKLEGAFRCRAVGSGLAAITAPLMGCLKAGDHLLMLDSVYAPTRRFCDGMLKRFGVETTYYDPLIGADIATLFRPNTRVLFLEAPGSHTFEMQDIPAMAAAARKAGITTMMDNTWASPYYFRPLEHGVDISIQAATKYFCGHSDVIMGTISCNEQSVEAVEAGVRDLGFFASPDDCYLVLRGMRTMAVRLPRHWESGLKLARWLQQQPEVDRVYHPALPEDPGYAIWKRDFSGATGLFSVGFKAIPHAAFAALVDGMKLFGMGASWGGFESLILPAYPAGVRTATKWNAPGPLLRIHAGLEDSEDQIADFDAGFQRLRAAMRSAAE